MQVARNIPGKYQLYGIAVLIIVGVSISEWLMLRFTPFDWLNIGFIFLACLIKVGFIMLRCFRSIVNISHQSVPYHTFLGFIAINIFLVVFTFSIDYFWIFQLNPGSFSGLETAYTPLQQYFKLFYLSLLLFTNMGVANVVPVSIPAEALVMLEAIVSFVTLIFMLSDYLTLRESLNMIRGKKQRKHLMKKKTHFQIRRRKSTKKIT
ncbi:MAG: hypothetical protein MUF42_02655 [Cytophagaceae bacterium]|nr:hypothetical protein [Cytophagaceae bacterium]